MALRWIFTCLLLSGLTCGTVWGETVPCMKTWAQCKSTGFSSISTINNNYYCCAPGYSMYMRNADCSCTKTSEAVPCTKGPEACHNAHSVSMDNQGNTVCCQNGFSMQNQVISINGRRSSSCTCSRSLHGGGGSSIMISSNNGLMSNVNSVDLQNWNRRFRNNMQRTMQAMAQQMQSVASGMERMRTHMQSFFTNMFRG